MNIPRIIGAGLIVIGVGIDVVGVDAPVDREPELR